jgi:protein phosphatase
MTLLLPDPSLVLLIGPSGAGKSTFAARHFQLTEIVSSDRCRAMLTDDESDQSANAQVFALVHQIVRARLALRKLTVVDATNLEFRARRPLLRMARQQGLPAVAIVFEVSLEDCLARNRLRGSRVVLESVIAKQADEFRVNLARLSREGYAFIHRLDASPESELRFQRMRNALSEGEETGS